MAADSPTVASGRIERLTDFPSRHVPARHIDVWLPDGYPDAGPYAVLYLHDGQMLFDAGKTWNGQEWRADEVAAELIAAGTTRPFIVVGIWNAGAARASEYFPQKPFESLAKPEQEALYATRFGENQKLFSGPVYSDRYLRFIVEELKPHIDAHYAVARGPEDTFIMGSSLGALISLYALAEYPEVFGAAACLSTHWPGRIGDGPDNPVPAAFFRYIERQLPAAGRHRLYFDHGTETLDASYADRQREVDRRLQAKGYTGTDWKTLTFPGAAHNERAWSARLHQPLGFLLPPRAGVPVRPIQDEIVYFVMPDRFANGDPDNDTGGIAGGPDAHGFDPARKGHYHGGDLKGLTQRLAYIQGLGATALWVTPVFVNKPVQGPPGQRSAGYHGYWITDFTRVDPHLGSNADFKALVDAAHARGMKVILDIVINHTADVIAYRECARVEDGGSGQALPDCPYRSIADYPYTTRGGPDREPINQGFLGDGPAQQTAENFARLSDPGFAYTPFVPEAERHSKAPAWLNDPIYYHNRGNSHWQGESVLYGDFSGLDDLYTEHPRVVAGMIEIYQRWISDYRIDGFRIDTARHVGDRFWQQFLPAILAHARAEGIADFYVFGETWAPEPADLARFTREAAFPAVLDFAFANTAQAVIAEGAPTRRLAKLFAADKLYAGGQAGAAILPTFLGNHDQGRFGYFLLKARGADAEETELRQRAELGYALMLFARGVPVVYYGDEQGFTGDGGDQDAREDMFPSRVASYNDNRLIGTAARTAADNFDPDHPLYRSIAAMAAVRRAEPGLRRGEQVVRFSENRPGVFAFSRIDRQSGIEYLVVLNTAGQPRHAKVPVGAGENAWRRLIGTGPEAPASHKGTLRIDLPALSYAVYRAERSPG